MKLTAVIGKQHLERMARFHWKLQGKKRIIQTQAAERVIANGREVLDSIETFLSPQPCNVKFDVQSVQESALARDVSHPDYKSDPCYIFGDKHVLLGGLRQAQVFTNSVLAGHSLPSNVLDIAGSCQIPTELHDELKAQILLSTVYDAEQKKLPKRKDPLRPAWNFPRDYGISASRKNELITRHIVRLCEQLMKSQDVSVIENAGFSLPLEAHGKSMQLELTAELMLTCATPLPPSPIGCSSDLPDIHPLHCTVSLEPQHFYSIRDVYPVPIESKWKYCHTAFVHFDATKVSNLFDVPVSADQIAGRMLMKAFCIASCQARALNTKGELAEPVRVQVVQTDGQFFSAMVFELNTLDSSNDGGSHVRNRFWIDAPMRLYSVSHYVNGRPALDGYNPAVLERICSLLACR